MPVLQATGDLTEEKHVIDFAWEIPTIVRTLWLAAERALFSCNDWALWKFFLARQLFWVASKNYEHVDENIKKDDKVQHLLYLQ